MAKDTTGSDTPIDTPTGNAADTPPQRQGRFAKYKTAKEIDPGNPVATVLRGIQEQRERATHRKEKGQPMEDVTYGPGGEVISKKPLTEWYSYRVGKQWVLQIKLGTSPLPIPGLLGDKVIEDLTDMDDILAALDDAEEGVKAGEFNEAIGAAAGKLGPEKRSARGPDESVKGAMNVKGPPKKA